MGSKLKTATEPLTSVFETGLDTVNSGLNMLGKGGKAANLIVSDINQRRKLRESEKQFQLAQQINEQKRQQDQAELAAKSALDEAARKRALRRAVAKSRVNAGARGLSATGGGSNEAILLGVFDDSQTAANATDQLNRLRSTSIDNAARSAQARNLLNFQDRAPDRSIFGRLVSGNIV